MIKSLTDVVILGLMMGFVLAMGFLAFCGAVALAVDFLHWVEKPRHAPPGYIVQNNGEHWYFVMYEKGYYTTNWSGGPGKQDVIDQAWKVYGWNHP